MGKFLICINMLFCIANGIFYTIHLEPASLIVCIFCAVVAGLWIGSELWMVGDK